MADAITASLAAALGLPPRPGNYIGGENRFRPIVDAARAGMGSGADFTYNALQLLLERLAAIEPLFQAPCAREAAVLEEIFNEAVDAVSYGRMIQFYVTRALSRLRYGDVPLPSPSIDIGCGDGFTPKLVFKGATVDVGSDLFVHDLIEARRIDAPFRRLEAMDIENLAYADGMFSTVFCMNTIYHAPDRAQALRELARIVAPGGTLYFDVIDSSHAEKIPLGRLLQAGGFKVAADGLAHSMMKPQAAMPIVEMLPGFDVEVTPSLSSELFNVAWFFHGLDMLLPFTVPTEERKARTLAFLRAVIAPLLAQDRELSAKGSAYLAVKATKHGHLTPTVAASYRCPKCAAPLVPPTCSACGVTYPAVDGIPLLATQYLEPFAEMSADKRKGPCTP